MASRLLVKRLLSPSRQGGTLLPSLQLVSWFGSSAADVSPEVVRALRCHDFQLGPLQSLAASRPTVPYTELLDIMQQQQ